MYTPDPFAIRDSDKIARFVARYDFGILVAVGEAGIPEATHVPFLYEPSNEGHGRLLAHVARANPVARLVATQGVALVVFGGPNGYVSPTWYRDPTEHVPTWNYVAVHARVRVEPLSDPTDVRRLLARTAERYEHGPGRWTVDTPRDDLVAELQRGVSAFSLPILGWEAKAKLSQNRDPEDRARVRAALARRGRPDDLGMLEWWDVEVRQ